MLNLDDTLYMHLPQGRVVITLDSSGSILVAVNGHAYKPDVLKDTAAAAKEQIDSV